MEPPLTSRKPRSILLATDLTPACDRAFDRAVQLAAEWDAELIACHVIEASSLRPGDLERRVRHAEMELEGLAHRLETPVRRHIVVGDPAERTFEHAAALQCDFIVTGPAHGKYLGEKLLGSTAARIVRRSNQPVLAVRRRADGPYKNIVTAVDFSAPSTTAFLHGRALFPSAHCTVLHAYALSPDWGGPNAGKSLDVVEADERSRVLRAAEQNMTELIRAAGDLQGVIETVLLENTPDAALAEHVDMHWSDLVIAGTHGRSGSQRDAIGSVAERLLMTLACDVLAVPTRT